MKVGADVLPWWPVRGAFLLLERDWSDPASLLEVDGVAGAWSVSTLPVDAKMASAPPGEHLTYFFLDDDPVTAARRLAPLLSRRWDETGTRPLLAAPFHAVVPHEWDRYVP